MRSTSQWLCILTAATLTACTSDTTAPTAGPAADLAAARPADACVNVRATATSTLGLWAYGGAGGFGATPFATELGGIPGTMASAVSYEIVSGSKGQGAHHIFLSHYFWADDGVSWFRTDDRASCAPADGDPATCQVNDHMRIVEGGGVFAGAEGQLHNHGWLRFTSLGPPPAGTIELRVTGRICGAGVSS